MDKLFEICKYGAIAITGENVGFKLFCAVGNDHVTSIHCLIHWVLLVTEKIAMELNDVLPDAFKVINFVKNWAFDSRLFFKSLYRRRVRLKKFNITGKSKRVVKRGNGFTCVLRRGSLRKLLLLKISILNYYKLSCFQPGKILILLFFFMTSKLCYFLFFWKTRRTQLIAVYLKIEGVTNQVL